MIIIVFYLYDTTVSSTLTTLLQKKKRNKEMVLYVTRVVTVAVAVAPVYLFLFIHYYDGYFLLLLLCPLFSGCLLHPRASLHVFVGGRPWRCIRARELLDTLSFPIVIALLFLYTGV